MLELYQILVPFVFLYMSAWYIISIILKRNDVADIAWGWGFFLSTAILLFINNSHWSHYLVFILITFWAWRLALHIFFRNKGKKEDYRYAKWRKDWGAWFYFRSFWQVFILQGLLMLVILLPVVAIYEQTISFNFFTILGIVMWLLGFIFETVSDYQLLKFIKNPNNRGQLLKSGLWQYSRHPNYFGEIIQWWGIWLLSLNFIAIIGPLLISFLIIKVSGIPMLEKKMEKHPEWDNYKNKTSVLIPFLKRTRELKKPL